MGRLSWNVRLVLGIVGIIIIGAIVLIIYYNLSRIRLDKPMDVEKYPDANLVYEDSPFDGADRQYYEVKGDVNTVNEIAQKVERFYADEDYTCRALYDNAEYVYSTCLLEKTNFWGFDRFNRILIVPIRDGNDTLTGSIGIDINRSWGAGGGLGN